MRMPIHCVFGSKAIGVYKLVVVVGNCSAMDTDRNRSFSIGCCSDNCAFIKVNQ